MAILRVRAALFLALGALSALSGAAFGVQGEPSANVWIVDASYNGEFPTIQEAVTAAASGDTVLIRSGTYGGFHVYGKSLHIITEPGAQVEVVGQVQVYNLASWHQVSIANLSVDPWYAVALLLTNNSGSVRLQECELRGAIASTRIENCADVAFTDCTMIGATPLLVGGDGLVVKSGSSVALYDCLVQGSAGADGQDATTCLWVDCTDGGDGGAGARLEGGAFLFASGCTFVGGPGGEGGYGFGVCDCMDGFDGDALFAQGGSSATLLDSTIQGSVQGDVQMLPGAARRVGLPPSLEELEPATVTCVGMPGDAVRLTVSPVGAFVYDPLRRGVELVGAPLAPDLAGRVGPTTAGSLQFPLSLEGTIPAGGALELPLRVLPLDPAFLALSYHVQGRFLDLAGQETLSNSRVLVTLARAASLNDCPPWECGPLPLVYVDDDAPNDPGPGNSQVSDPLEDGTPEHPFDAIQTALDLVAPNGTVVVLQGVYTGAGNVELEFHGHSIHLLGEDGPERCIIDGEDQPVTLLRLEGGGSSSARVEGLAFTRSASTAIQITGTSPTIHGCIVSDNASAGAPGIHIVGGTARITNCTIARNHSTTVGAGIRAMGTDAEIVVRNCSILDNVALNGAAVYSLAGELRLEGSTVAGNSSSMQIFVLGVGPNSPAQLHLTSSLVWGNFGGALYVGNNSDTAYIDFADLQGGSAGVGGSGTLVWGAGNIDADPLFVDPLGGDYHIVRDSPCVGAGQPGFALEPDELDIDAEPRVAWGRVDIGADEVVEDCDRDGTPDFQQGTRFASPYLSPIGALHPQHHTVPAPPPADVPVLLELWARADLASPDQRIDVLINGVPMGSAFVTGAQSCPIELDRAALVIPAERFNAAVGGGDAEFTLLASAPVDPNCSPPFSLIRFVGSYGGDCDQNGILDACELALGLSPDANGNGVLDACE